MAIDKSTTKIKDKDISEWYTTTLKNAEVFDYGPVKGTIIFRPYGYAVWEKTQKLLDDMFKKGGVQNAYFPLLIPYSLIQKEAHHVKGFAPEVAIVTHAGGEKLDEAVVIRPTSETIIYDSIKNWIQSYKDLPLKLNQWCNVVRWEKRTFPFMRTSEFLWQEGHTVHTTYEEADAMAREALDWYATIYEDYFGIEVFKGIKSESEKFAGAKRTYTLEIIMPDGKALQAATTHVFDSTFSKSFGVQYTDNENKKVSPYTTSWGFSTRSLAALYMVHGDDYGLVLPPNIAPTQIVIMPIYGASKEPKEIHKTAHLLAEVLEKAGYSYILDKDTDKALPERRTKWELRGIPMRIEIGEREVTENTLTIVRRDTIEKRSCHQGEVLEAIEEIKEQIQTNLKDRTRLRNVDFVDTAENYAEFKEKMEAGKKFIKVFFAQDETIEAKIKEETKATTRCLKLEYIDNEADQEWGICFYSGKKTKQQWLFARSY
jgi:prolyl-tRNA synthetase